MTINKDYSAYLNSDEWKQKRKQRLEIDGYKCVMCGSNKHLVVHHMDHYRSYSTNNPHENVETDLITLCWDCHLKVHGRVEGKKGVNLKMRDFWEDRLFEKVYPDPDDREKHVAEREQYFEDLWHHRKEYLLQFDAKFGSFDVAEKGTLNFCKNAIGRQYINVFNKTETGYEFINKYGDELIGAFLLNFFYSSKHTLVIQDILQKNPGIKSTEIRKEYGFSANSISAVRKALKSQTLNAYLTSYHFKWQDKYWFIPVAKEALKRKGLL